MAIKFNITKARVPNGIYPWFLKEMVNQISLPSAKIFQTSLNTNIVPKD
jgi:hypothetical protein